MQFFENFSCNVCHKEAALTKNMKHSYLFYPNSEKFVKRGEKKSH